MRVIYPLAALALVTVGCSSDRQSTVETATASTLPAEATSPATGSTTVQGTAAAGTDPPATTDPRLSGTQDVELPDLDVSFAAPDTYTPLVPTELDAAFYDSAGFEDLASRLQIDEAVFAQSLRETLAIFLFAPAEATGYVDNISVTAAPETPLPEVADVGDVLAPLDASGVEIEPVNAGGVEAIVASYTRPAANGALFARDVMFETNGSLLTIGILTGSEDNADVVSNVVLSTLRVTSE